jgi:hypothetical protein
MYFLIELLNEETTEHDKIYKKYMDEIIPLNEAYMGLTPQQKRKSTIYRRKLEKQLKIDLQRPDVIAEHEFHQQRLNQLQKECKRRFNIRLQATYDREHEERMKRIVDIDDIICNPNVKWERVDTWHAI